MSVRLQHPAGHAEAAFSEAVVILGGIEQKVRFLVIDLPHSDAIFLQAYCGEAAEALCDGQVAAFAVLGSVPLSIRYDNTTLAVAQILGAGTRMCSSLFAGLQCLPGCSRITSSPIVLGGRRGGNDTVEGMVGFARRTFMVPIPEHGVSTK